VNAAGVWFAIAVIGVGTYLIRFSFFFLFGKVGSVPPHLERALEYVPAAVLAALVAPSFILIDGALPGAGGGPLAVLMGLAGNERLLAGIVAALVAWYTESILATIVVGLGTLLALQLF
jgi:branched-subunit amino acid transport protein